MKEEKKEEKTYISDFVSPGMIKQMMFEASLTEDTPSPDAAKILKPYLKREGILSMIVTGNPDHICMSSQRSGRTIATERAMMEYFKKHPECNLLQFKHGEKKITKGEEVLNELTEKYSRAMKDELIYGACITPVNQELWEPENKPLDEMVAEIEDFKKEFNFWDNPFISNHIYCRKHLQGMSKHNKKYVEIRESDPKTRYSPLITRGGIKICNTKKGEICHESSRQCPYGEVTK